MPFLFNHPARTFRPAPVYPQAPFEAFGEPAYDSYAPGSGLSPYGDRDVYLHALAAEQQQRRQQEYAYAAAQAALAEQQQQQELHRRQQEYQYAAALAVEEERHKAALRQIAERKSLAGAQKPYTPYHHGYPTTHPIQPPSPPHLSQFAPPYAPPFHSAQGPSFEQFLREAERQKAVRIARARAEQEVRVAQEQERRRVLLEQARRRKSELAFLDALFSEAADTEPAETAPTFQDDLSELDILKALIGEAKESQAKPAEKPATESKKLSHDGESSKTLHIRLDSDPTPEQMEALRALFSNEQPGQNSEDERRQGESSKPKQPEPQRRAPRSRRELLEALYGGKTEEKQAKGKGKETQSSQPHSKPQSKPQPAPVEVKANVPEPSTSQQSDSAPAPASPVRAISVLSSIEHEFDTLRTSFTFPTSLDFSPATNPKDDAPQLIYNSANLPLRVYEQQLTGLLTKLDEVDSEGVQSVRDARKKLVRDIEQVLEEMDKKKEEAWEKTVTLHKDIEVPVESSQVEVEKVAARTDEEIEYVEAPVQEELPSLPNHIEPTSQSGSSDVVLGYDVSPVPSPSTTEVEVTAVVTEEAAPSNTFMEGSILISSEESSRTVTPSPYNGPTTIGVDTSSDEEVAQPIADANSQSSSEEERRNDDAAVLTAEADGALGTEEVERHSEGGSDFEIL